MSGIASDTPPPESNNLSRVKLLLIDDDEDFRSLCVRFLNRASSMKNVDICLAGTAQEGIEVFRQHDFDCLVVDYRLPDSTGTDMLLALSDEYDDIKPASIILTAGSAEEAAIQAIRVDAADFMPKSEVTRTSLDRAISNAIIKSRLKKSVSLQNKELRLANDELLKNSKEINQFYHNVSHEVKTPLTAIREFQQLMHDEVCGTLTDEQHALINYSLESCDQITLLFNDLLDMTRLEFGKFKIDPTLQSPGPLIDQCICAIKPQASRIGISIENLVERELPQISLDKHRYVQIIGNLLSNAVKFTKFGGNIRISTCHDEHGFHLSVEDTGCGIDEASVLRVFDRLYQAPLGDEHVASSAGLGLGLSIARDIARKHGGDIVVRSELGVGSQFTVTIPLFQPEQLANAA